MIYIPNAITARPIQPYSKGVFTEIRSEAFEDTSCVLASIFTT
ncbi:MAG: hypothetical protein ACP5PS_05735 [Bacteroidales bacterium]